MQRKRRRRRRRRRRWKRRSRLMERARTRVYQMMGTVPFSVSMK
jgi:hypothetical protein